MLLIRGYSISTPEISYFWGFTEIKRYIPGNIWAFLSRAHILSKKEIPIKETLSLTIYEVEFITLGSLLISLLSLNFIIYGILPPFAYKTFFVIGIVCVICLLQVLFVANVFFLRRIPRGFTLLRKILPQYSPADNLKLLLVKTAAMFLFGMGTYFSLSAVVPLYVPFVLTFVGFFVFSLLVGYLSIITPMGLGVRETLITIGLSKFMAVPLAGFSAIFARLIFIISELIFLFIASIWYTNTNTRIKSLERFIKKYRYEILLGGAVVLYIIYFTFITFLRYANFFTGRFDLGNMDQTVWNTLHGRLFQSTDPNGTDIISRLAFHADFILVLLAPLYLIWQDPKTLLFIQTFILGLGALPVYAIAFMVLRKRPLALLFSVAYLLNPSVEYSNLYDFHGVTLATTFLFASWYFMKKKKYILLCVFLFLSGLTKEEVWIIVAFIGLYIAFFEKKKMLGIGLFTLSAAIFSFLLFYVIPHMRGGAHFALSYYSDFGSSPKEIFINLVFHPEKTIPVLFHQGQLTYLFELFAPLGFLSIIYPIPLLFILPEITADLLSTNSTVHQIFYQYTATLTPFIFISTIYALSWIYKRRGKIFRFAILLYLGSWVVLSAYWYGPLPGAQNPNLTVFLNQTPYKDIISNFLSGIPRQYSVAATNNLGSHLSHRQKIFTIPVGMDKADIILFLLNDPFAQPSLETQKRYVKNMKQDKNYIEIFKLGEFVVFEKRNLYMKATPAQRNVKLFPVSIPALQNRDFSGGKFTVEKKVNSTPLYTNYLMSYPSDGLKIYALVTIPAGKPGLWGYPVIILNHSVDRKKYNTITSYSSIATYFSSHGFLVIKPDYRGNGNSEDDQTLPHTLSYPVDILNLISSLPTLRQADTSNVFLWGHSIGATVTLSAIEAHDNNRNLIYPLRGAALWAPVTDPYLGYLRFRGNTPENNIPYNNAFKLLGTPQKNPALWQSVSPLFYVKDITTPIQINQGLSDTIIPYQWSIELYDDLLSDNTTASLRLYPNEDHSFSHVEKKALDDNIAFFKKLLKK